MKLAPPPDAVLSVLRRLHAEGRAAWCVGGCVRDRLLGRSVNDWDVTTDAPPEEVLRLFAKAIPTGLKHGTVTVVVDEMPIEVTTYRVEVGYSDGRRPDEVRFTDELEEDLARRDFTMNAIAWDPERDRIVDPFGGLHDVKAGILRAVGAAIERFSEDGLRPLRAVRFASVLGLTIDAETWAAIPATLETFRRVSAERIRVELAKLLGGPRPRLGMELLDASGLLAAFLPEVAAVEEGERARIWAGLDRLRRPSSRRAAPFWPLGAEAADAALRRLRFSTHEIRDAVHALGFREQQAADLTRDADVRRFVAAVGVAALDDVLELHAAYGDAQTWAALAARIDALDARRGPLAPRDLPLTGREVMLALGIPPSRRVGRILDALLERVWQDPDACVHDRLLAMLPEVASEVGE